MANEADEEFMLLLLLRKRQKKRRIWVHDINKGRERYGEYNTLVRELSSHEDKFFNYFRMGEEQFEHLLSLVKTDLEKQVTHFRKPISARERLALCLRYLATGDSYKSFSYTYRVGKSTIVDIVPETCNVLWCKLQPLYMPVPQRRTWETIAEGFLTRWQFPNCIGSIDGKHVVIQAPPNSGSAFFNYKHTFSMVLMALVDASYCFTVIDVGAFGSNSDGGIFARSRLGEQLELGQLDIPPSQALPGANEIGPLPFVMVGDEAFPLKPYLMRPFPGHHLSSEKRIYNYRLSRARRVVENAFGILAARWRIFHRRMQLHPSNAENVIKAACVVHNFIQKVSTTSAAASVAEGESRNDGPSCLHGLPMRGCHAGPEAMDIRDKFKQYFSSSAGSVPWQISSCFGDVCMTESVE